MIEVPQEDWSMDELGKFCQKTVKKLAIHAWQIGKAVEIARLKGEWKHGFKKDWINKWLPGFSIPTIDRWRALAQNCPDPTMLEGLRLGEAYESVLHQSREKPKEKDDIKVVQKVEKEKGEGQDGDSFLVLCKGIETRATDLLKMPKASRWEGATKQDVMVALLGAIESLNLLVADLQTPKRRKAI